MLSKQELALRDIYGSWPDERLLRAATLESHQYRPEAVIAMQEELNKRGLSAETAAALPPQPMHETTGPRKVVSGVAGYFQRKIISLVLLIAGFVGLIAAELLTRGISHSNTYYQQHSLPRFGGALLAFAFSYATLKGVVWFLRWTRSDKRLSREDIDPPQKKDREVVGLACYTPYVILIIGVVVAIIPD